MITCMRIKTNATLFPSLMKIHRTSVPKLKPFWHAQFYTCTVMRHSKTEKGLFQHKFKFEI